MQFFIELKKTLQLPKKNVKIKIAKTILSIKGISRVITIIYFKLYYAISVSNDNKKKNFSNENVSKIKIYTLINRFIL